MKDILTYLEQLELSEIEAKLYLKLLETGPISIRELAQKIEIKRTTAYLYIEQLLEKGLITKMVRGSHPQVAANPPQEALQALVEKQVATATKAQQQLPDILKDLSAFNTPTGTEQFEIKHYKSIEGIKKIYEDAFQANELRTYIKLVEQDPVFPDNISLFTEAFERNKNLHVKEILYKSPKMSEDAQTILKDNERYQYKFMPENMHLTSEDILIYDGKVAIIHYKGKSNSNSVILRSSDYYNNSVEFFDFIWKTI